MRRLIVLFSLFLTPLAAVEEEPMLILNALNRATVLPEHFRTSQNTLRSCQGRPAESKGLTGLKLSGSGQFSEQGLQQILATLCHPKLAVIDLRQESHGFINGIAISWFIAKDRINAGKTLNEIQSDERLRLDQIKGQPSLTIYGVESKNASNAIQDTISILIRPQVAELESEVCKKAGVGYFRLPVADHARPSDATIEDFLRFYNALSPDTWLHFHCAAGDGRTTTFLCMVDMLHNAKRVSFEQIIRRQHELGGANLAYTPPPSQWKYEDAKARLEFLRQFYAFCQENKPQTWTSFSQKQSTAR